MSTALAKTNSELKHYLNGSAQKQSIIEACAQGVSPERLIKAMCMVATATPKKGELPIIEKCTKESILRVVVDCARFGIDPSFGRAYVIPYGNEAQLQIGYLGLIDLAKRSGEIKSITAELVQEGDVFDVEIGTHPKFVHRPKFQGDGNGFKYVYALAIFNDDHFEYTVLSKDDVENIRQKFSKAPNSPAWQKSYGEMAKKCAIRRLCKTLPLTIEAQEAIDTDDRRHNVLDVEVVPPTDAEAVDRAFKRPDWAKQEREDVGLLPPSAETAAEEADEDDDDEIPIPEAFR